MGVQEDFTLELEFCQADKKDRESNEKEKHGGMTESDVRKVMLE